MDRQYPLESTPKAKRIRKELPAPIVVDTDSDSSVLCYPECSPSAIHICGDLATFDNSVTFDGSADTSVLVYSLTESKSELDSPVLFYNPNARLKRRMIHPYWSGLHSKCKRRDKLVNCSLHSQLPERFKPLAVLGRFFGDTESW